MVKHKSKIKKIIGKLNKGLENRGVIVKQLILFGSYVRNQAKPYSDIDLAIISPTFRKWGILKRQELLGEIIFPIGEPIEALGYTPEEYRKADKMSFLGEIKRIGRVIYKA